MMKVEMKRNFHVNSTNIKYNAHKENMKFDP